MYFEQLAKLTADHLRTHIEAYLASIAAEYTGSQKVQLVVPKSIEPASVVGGMISEFDKIMPQYGVDCLGKAVSGDSADLYTYEYAGQINGLVAANSREIVDKLVHRHERAVERFIREHQYMHEHENANFKLLEFTFGGVDLSGAEDLMGDESKWLAGFSINVSWFTSEDGPQDHG